MPSYTYDDFLNAVNSSGLLHEFSQADLDTAREHPEFGLSILSLKQDYHNATTDEQRLLANEAANQLRNSYGNYSGGDDGGYYIDQGKIPGQVDNILDEIYNFGDFSYGSAPTYSNAYAQQQQQLLNDILNRPDFSYDRESDPVWHSYRQSYLREGDRATANALAQASAASGGRPSSYAATAASQAGDYYNAQLQDVIPTLYQQAYDRYLNEYQMMLSDLNQVNTQEQLDYQKYLNDLSQFNTDRNFAFNQYLSDFDILQNQLGALQGQDAVDYDRYMDQVGLRLDNEATQQALAQAQVDAMLAAGGSPSADLIAQSGYSNEYVQALEEAYRRELAGNISSGGGGGGGRGSSGGGSGSSSGGGPNDSDSGGPLNEIEAMVGHNTATEHEAMAENYSAVRNYINRLRSQGATAEELRGYLRSAYSQGVLNLTDYLTLLNSTIGS